MTVGLWDAASTGIPLPPAPWAEDAYGAKGEIIGFDDEAVLSAFQVDTRSLLLYHRARARGYYLTLDAAQLPQSETGAPLRAIWHWWAREIGCQLIHAGAVGTRVGGVLLVGSGGAGKSNTALACLQSDLGYAGDDYCLLRAEPVPIAYSLYSSAKVRRADLERLAFPAVEVGNPTSAEGEKGLYFLHEQFAERLIASFPVSAILIPRVTGKRDTSVVPAPASEALLALVPNTRAQLPYAGGEIIMRAAQLVRRVPGFYLNVGTDSGQIPQSILSVLETYRARELSA